MTPTKQRRRQPLSQSSAADATEDIAASLDARKVREIVRDELRRMFGRILADERTYSTRAGGSPEGYSRDAWRVLARKIGRKRGRYWVVTNAELDAYEHGDRDTKPANDAPTTSSWTPAVAARALGLRPAGGAR